MYLGMKIPKEKNMGVINSNKLVSRTEINCGEELRVTIAFTATPDISSNPTDIVLVLDRSGSMAGSPLANLKLGANKFIDIIDEATDSSQDGQIGSGSRIGIVSFASTATEDTQLITSVADLKSAVDALTADGTTNHADAFTKAINLFDPSSSNAKVMVMFTDGNTTAGGPPAPVAEEAKAQGITIFVIGLIGSDGIDVNALNEWASDPDSAHVAVTPDDSDLEELFEDLAENISKPGATNIKISEVVNSDFEIINIENPLVGSVNQISTNELEWTIDSLGVNGSESAVLEFDIRDISNTPGEKYVNDSIVYTDNENNSVTFPTPTVLVDCGIIVHPEDCPTPTDFTVSGCSSSITYDLGDTCLVGGRMVQVNFTLTSVCPQRQVAVAVNLTELDSFGDEHQRGFKAFLLPAHTEAECRDIEVRCVRFVLPEELNVSCNNGMCEERNLRARVYANYVDNDFVCCDEKNPE